MEEEDIIRRRLLTNEAPLKKICRLFITFTKACNTQSVEECQAIYKNFLRELTFYEFELNSQNAIRESIDRDLKNYAKLYETREKAIADIQTELIELKDSLARERIIKQQKEEYDALAATINQLPSRKSTMEEMSILNQEVEVLKKQSEEIDHRVQVKRKQLQLLVDTVRDLMNTIDEEKQQEQKKKEEELNRQKQEEQAERERLEKEQQEKEQEALGNMDDSTSEVGVSEEVVPMEVVEKGEDAEEEEDREEKRERREEEEDEDEETTEPPTKKIKI